MEGFYEHIRMLVGGIDSAEGRQKVIAELYEKFFKKVVPKEASSLGIVYTPVEIVDFINCAVNDLLCEHFDGASLSDEGVHVLDPFTGTGTFIARMIQSGLISPDALPRKYASELHANEIMLLAYYIAAINIETAYRGAIAEATGEEPDGYDPFTGIVLADTFQMSEVDDSMDTVFFPRNNSRADRQKELDIRVIVGNPPYSVGQSSQNDNNANLTYPTLDASIEQTYVRRSTATNKRNLYDSYVRALRWATDRISGQTGGVAAFVINGGWIDSTTGDGIRASMLDEFDQIYVYNLRGNQKGDWRREGGKVFGEGSQVGICVVLAVRTPASSTACTIRYRETPDFATKDDKLSGLQSVQVGDDKWRLIVPNEQSDWLRQRRESYQAFLPLGDAEDAVFLDVALGAVTARDAWVYNSSENDLRQNVQKMCKFFNDEVSRFAAGGSASGDAVQRARATVHRDSEYFSWSRSDYTKVARGHRLAYEDVQVLRAPYRPFFHQHLAFSKDIIEVPGRTPALYPSPLANIGFSTVGPGNEIPFSVIASQGTPQLHLLGASSGTSHHARWRFPARKQNGSLLDDRTDNADGEPSSNVNPVAATRLQEAVGGDVTDDDVFHYVHGLLHSPQFRSEFEVNLKKEVPRVPVVTDRETFDAFVEAGAELLNLHAGYEDVEPYTLTEEWLDGIGPSDPGFDPARLLVGNKKMKYPKTTDTNPESETYGKKIPDKTRLIYNDYLTLSGIPIEAHDYVLGTRSGIDWIIDRWYVKTDKASGIVNDVNQWGLEQGNPRYIIDLIKRVVTVSLRTVEIVESLPKLRFDENGTHVVESA